MMVAFRVSDMINARCVAAVTRALRKVDPRAVVQIDLHAHVVEMEAHSATARRFAR
ncbi:heavy-metal-associated domain-containing protein [Roseateles sp. P5_E4]